MCDAALEEPGLEAIEDFVKGGSDEESGFASTLRESRARQARLAATVPSMQNILSARRKRIFLSNLATSGNIGIACAAAGWSRGIPYSLRKADTQFAEMWDHAMENAADILEAAAFRRAVHGVQEEVWHKTKESATVVGHVTKYSDGLLTTLLKGAKPEKFGDQKSAPGGENKGGVLVVPAPMSFDDWGKAAYEQQAKYREKQEIE